VNESNDFYKRCSTCKSPIDFGATYYTCSVSTCNRPKLALFFCSVPCWEAHVPEARHRDAWAEQQKAPFRTESAAVHAEQPSPPVRARVVTAASAGPSIVSADADADDDALVVVSKLKRYIRVRSEMNTSDTVFGPLSNHLRQLCNEAIRNAARDGRKTVLDRDFAPLIGKKLG
jgi:hypothetical protein